MALLMRTDSDRAPWWRDEVAKLLPDLDFRIYPETGRIEDIEYALVWRPPQGLLRSLPSLKAIFSLGAGVDHVFADPNLPEGVPVVRLIDVQLTRQMTEYAVWHVLRFHRNGPEYEAQQRQRVWREVALTQTVERRVGVMGLGEIGGAVARALVGFGFDVAGWSRGPKSIPGVASFAGREKLHDFLARSEIVVCVLPLTPDTTDILDARAFAAMPRGACVINIGRGPHLVESDLVAALDAGHVAGAALDVFRTEPLPQDSPLWSHPAVTLTPHIAGMIDPRSAVQQVVANIRRIRAGEKPLNIVDPRAGY
ncbi:MAG: glyoxylate/hydroxypyruvate reductase A [Alphaproteobacteria bacterium]|nr:glyoxylate/hydroxypyruvate reductase A [Alphaproteobacteria bacterium]